MTSCVVCTQVPDDFLEPGAQILIPQVPAGALGSEEDYMAGNDEEANEERGNDNEDEEYDSSYNVGHENNSEKLKLHDNIDFSHALV